MYVDTEFIKNKFDKKSKDKSLVYFECDMYACKHDIFFAASTR